MALCDHAFHRSRRARHFHKLFKYVIAFLEGLHFFICMLIFFGNPKESK